MECIILFIDTTQSGQPKDITPQHNATAQWLGGLTWVTLTCSAGVIGYVIGEDIGVFAGTVCAIITVTVCIGVILWVHRRNNN